MIEKFHEIEPYSLNAEEKEQLLLPEVKERIQQHREKSKEYDNILKILKYDEDKCLTLKDLPFIPVRIFKEMDLKSIADDEVFKIMTSSGTTGNNASRIYLNRENAMLQQKVQLRLLSDFIGKKRLPMLVIDTDQTVKNRNLFSARGATIIGLDFAARNMTFALDENMNLKEDTVNSFLEKYGQDNFLIFGFTFMVWQHLYNVVEERNLKYDMHNGSLLTGGGWKKLESNKVTSEKFKERGKKLCNIMRFIDHYGMAEQSGSVYYECEYGHLHASIYSDVITRRYEDFSCCEFGEKGILQVISSLPRSYPGNSLLTEDEGVILGEDDCPCGRKGKYIKVIGRLRNAELRGCSDTYAATV